MKFFRDLILITIIAAGGIGSSQIPQLIQEYEQAGFKFQMQRSLILQELRAA
jgi:hypothetical protein